MGSCDLNLITTSLFSRKTLILSDFTIYIRKDLSLIRIFIFWNVTARFSRKQPKNKENVVFVCVTDHFSSFRFWQNLWHSEKNCYDVITHHNDVIIKELGYQGIYFIVIYYCAKFQVFSISLTAFIKNLILQGLDQDILFFRKLVLVLDL